MKKLLFTGLLCFTLLSLAQAQYTAERSGYEGDYFSLEGALELFQNSKNLNQFERKLNREDSWVNNLDLNWDGQIDYIRVEHNRQGSFHAIVLQAIISKYEIQDVAVIEIEKIGRYDAVLQIVGDADLYGEEVIVESRRDQNAYASNVSYRGYDNVYNWQPVQYIFAPRYVVYVSPYRWSYYPTWWSPWRQCGWNTYYPRIVNYHNYYHVTNVHRVVNVHNYYYPSRTFCSTVSYRARDVRRQHGHSNAYRSTHQRNTKVYKSHPRNTNAGRQVSKPNGRGNGHTAQSYRGKNNRVSTAPTTNRKPGVSQKPTRNTSGVSTLNTNRGTRINSTSSRQKQPAVSKPSTRSSSSARSSSSRSSSRAKATTSRQSRPSVSMPSTRSSSSARSASSRSSSRAKATPSRQSKSSVSKPSTRSSSSARSSSSRSSSRAKATPSRQSKPSVSKSSTRSSSSARSSSSKSSSRAKATTSRQSKPSTAKSSTRRGN